MGHIVVILCLMSLDSLSFFFLSLSFLCRLSQPGSQSARNGDLSARPSVQSTGVYIRVSCMFRCCVVWESWESWCIPAENYSYSREKWAEDGVSKVGDESRFLPVALWYKCNNLHFCMFRSLFTRWKWPTAHPVGQTQRTCTTSFSSWCLTDVRRCLQNWACTALYTHGTGRPWQSTATLTQKLLSLKAASVSQSAAGSPRVVIYWS